MRGCFANAALVFFAVSVSMVPALFRASGPRAMAQFHTESPLMKSGAVLLLALQYLIFLMPPIVATVNALAWWKLKNAGRGARGWALAASISFLLLSAPLLAADFVLLSHPMMASRGWSGVFILSVILLSIGVAGLVAFWKRGATCASVPLPKIVGDGTHKGLDALVAVLQLGGLILGMNLYMRWGHAQGLPLAHGLEAWVQIAFVILVVVVIHESAHAIVGVALGMKLHAFLVGPFQWTKREGR